MVQIYTLSDPRTNIVRYVGKTVKPLDGRLSEHLRDTDNNKKSHWISGLRKVGLKPIIELVVTTDNTNWKEEEQFYISYFKFLGVPLLNMTDGGDGISGAKRSIETRKKQSQAVLNNPEERKRRSERRREANKRNAGKKLSATHIEKVRQAGIGRNVHKTEESRRRLNNFLRSDPERYKQIVAKRAISQSKPIAQYDKDINEVARYSGASEAAKTLNINRTSLSNSVRRGKPYKGFYWKYI